MVVVAPLDLRWHGHQDRFGAPTRLQAEKRAPVEHQVELDIAAATHRLPAAFPFAVGQRAPALDDRQVGGGKAAADRPGQRERTVEIRSRQVVEEYPPDPARLVAVLEEEVAVAPCLVLGIAIRAERCQCIAAGTMEVHGIRLEAVIGREIHATAEPPDRLAHGVIRQRVGDEEADVHVHRGHERVARMQHQRHAHRFEAAPGQFRPAGAGRRRQPITHHVREIHPATFEQRAAFDHAGQAATAARALPAVAAETAAIGLLEFGDDPGLQPGEEGLDLCCIGYRHVDYPCVGPAVRPAARCPISCLNCAPAKRIHSTAS